MILYLGARLEDLFKEGRPGLRVLFGKVEAEVLKRLIGVIATHMIWNWIVLVLTVAYVNKFIMVDIGIAALPVLAEFQCDSRHRLVPALRALHCSQVFVAEVSQFLLIKQVVLEEVCDVQCPLDVNFLTVGTSEDGSYRVMSIHQGL